MRIDEMPAVIHDWPEHTRLTEGDAIDTVKVVPGTDVPRVREAEPAPIPRLSSEGPARLIQRDNAVDNHAQRVTGLTTALRLALDQLTLPKHGARDWATDLRYGDLIIERINEASVAIHEALDLIDIHENG